MRHNHSGGLGLFVDAAENDSSKFPGKNDWEFDERLPVRSAPREENSNQIGSSVDSLADNVSAPNHACGVQKSEMDIWDR
jgi:hypothetical protein